MNAWRVCSSVPKVFEKGEKKLEGGKDSLNHKYSGTFLQRALQLFRWSFCLFKSRFLRLLVPHPSSSRKHTYNILWRTPQPFSIYYFLLQFNPGPHHQSCGLLKSGSHTCFSTAPRACPHLNSRAYTYPYAGLSSRRGTSKT